LRIDFAGLIDFESDQTCFDRLINQSRHLEPRNPEFLSNLDFGLSLNEVTTRDRGRLDSLQWPSGHS
jgi:hypothetical protein